MIENEVENVVWHFYSYFVWTIHSLFSLIELSLWLWLQTIAKLFRQYSTNGMFEIYIVPCEQQKICIATASRVNLLRYFLNIFLNKIKQHAGDPIKCLSKTFVYEPKQSNDKNIFAVFLSHKKKVLHFIMFWMVRTTERKWIIRKWLSLWTHVFSFSSFSFVLCEEQISAEYQLH